MKDHHAKPDKPAEEAPLIELEAEDITPAPTATAETAKEAAETLEKAAAEEAASAPAEAAGDTAQTPRAETSDAPPQKSWRWLWPVALLVIGMGAGGWLYREALFSYLPPDSVTQLQTRQAQSEKDLAALTQQNNELQATLAQLNQANQNNAKAITSLQASDAAAAAKLTSELENLKASLSAAPNGGSTSATEQAALANLSSRVTAVEDQLAALKTAPPAAPPHQAEITALHQLTTALNDKIAKGEAYASDYQTLAQLLPNAAGLNTLALYAARGLPNTAQLGSELASLIPQLPKANELAENATSSGWGLGQIITIRKVGEVNWAEIASKALSAAQAGDLRQAISLIDQAPLEKPTLLSAWRDKASQRLELEAAWRNSEQAITQKITQLVATP